MNTNINRQEFIYDIIDTAIEEGGIDYWAEIGGVVSKTGNGKEKIIEIKIRGWQECEPQEWTKVDEQTIRRAIHTLKEQQVGMNKGFWGIVLVADVLNDATDISPEIADCLVQVGLFGEVMYGEKCRYCA